MSAAIRVLAFCATPFQVAEQHELMTDSCKPRLASLFFVIKK